MENQIFQTHYYLFFKETSMKTIYIFLTILFFITCSNDNSDLHFKKANEFRQNKNYSKAIIELENAAKINLNSVKLDEIFFLLGEIYLNDIKDYNYAIDQFKKIKESSDLHAKSTFMLGYIFSNNLNQFSDAINYYTLFINSYPKHELYPSVEYELEQLNTYRSVIDSLNIIAKSRKAN